VMSRTLWYFATSVSLFMLLVTAVWKQSMSFPLPEQTATTFHWSAGKRVAVSLSFDDARLSQIDKGLDLLRPTGVKVTFYVSPDNVMKRLESWKRAMANGHEIGNHTLTHPCSGNLAWSFQNPLENYTVEQMTQQIDEANTEIQRLLGVRIATFAYPCGQKFVGRGQAVKSYVPLVAERFLVGRGWNDDYTNNPAFCDLAQAGGTVFDDMDYIEMVELISKAAEQGRWVIFVGHEIGGKAPFTTDATALAALCRYLQDPAQGVWVDTVENIGKYVRYQRAGK
jgi:peptidoglycan-N-acetylglucosamine deacetylase